MNVNKTQLADIVGVSHVTLTEWQTQGLPIADRAERKGQSHSYSTVDVIAWMVKREMIKANAEGPRNRLLRLQSDEVEIRLAEKMKQVVLAEEIEPAWASVIAAARSYLRAEPDRLAHLLDLMDGLEAKRDLLAETFDAFLLKLSTFDLPDEGEFEEGAAHLDKQGLQEVRPTSEDLGSDLG